jgi:copper chaperone CopZ
MGCVNSVKNLISPLAGVSDVQIDLAAGRVTVEHDPALVSQAAISAAIEDGGYEVVG